MVLPRTDKRAKSSREIYDFLQMELAVLVYQKAPTVLFNNDNQREWCYPLKSRDSEFMEIINAWDQPMCEHTEHEMDAGVLEGERLMSAGVQNWLYLRPFCYSARLR